MATRYELNKHPERYRAFCFNIGFLIFQLLFFISLLYIILQGSPIKNIS